MTQEDKELLLKDLCNRLPCGVKVKILDPDVLPYETSDVGTIVGKEHVDDDYYTIRCEKEGWILEVNRHFIPYLRPMSSMTEDEKEEYDKFFTTITAKEANFGKWISPTDDIALIDWYNKHHFDYRGLIEKGLAIAVTEENNPYK